MIKITKTSKPSKRKNPHLEDIKEFIENNSSKFKYLNKGIEGRAFYFKLDKKLVVNTEILQPGEYVLKVFHISTFYSKDNINQYLLLSKYGLIPKVFVITNNYIIMKYVSANNYYKIYDNLSEKEKITVSDRIQERFNIWKKLGFYKYIDTEGDNILVSTDLKHIYIIDPFLHY